MGHVYFRLTFGNNEPRKHRIRARQIIIGRADDCTVAVHDDEVSRKHLSFTESDGIWSVVDLASHNGTWVDGEKSSRAPLNVGTIVRLGRAGPKIEILGLDPEPVAPASSSPHQAQPVSATPEKPSRRERRAPPSDHKKPKYDATAAPSKKKSYAGRFITLVVLLGAVAAGGLYQDEIKDWYQDLTKKKRTYASSPEISLTIEPGSEAERIGARVETIDDLDQLPTSSSGQKVVAAGRFEPTGARFKDGLEVTWPLAKDLKVGQELAIVYRDKAKKKWVHEGNFAEVEKGGQTARGRVYHFSDIGLFELPSTTPAPTPSDPPPFIDTAGAADDDERTYFRIVYKSAKPKVVKKAKIAEVKRIYAKWRATAGADAHMPMSKMVEIYRAGDFETVKTVIENGDISTKHSYDMADMRTLMAIDGVENAVNKIKADVKTEIKIYRSDSGNQMSGARSDMDQTLLVFKKEGDAWVRAPDLDEKAVLHVEDHVRRQGLTPDKFDMATIQGKDRFYDWRLVGTQADAYSPKAVKGKPFKTKIEYAIRALRGTPGAYWLCGAVHQQMVMRVNESIEKNLKNVDPNRVVPADGRAMHPELQKKLPRANMQVCAVVESGKDGKLRTNEVSLESAKKVMFEGVEPKLTKGHAYDAATNNLFDYMDSDKISKTLDPTKEPPVKNPLRAVDDGLGTRYALENDVPKVDYLDIKDPAKRKQHLKNILGDAVAGKADARSGQPLVDRWYMVMEASRDLRVAHKEKGVVKQADLDKAFEPLAREMGGDPADPKSWKKAMEMARQEYHVRCQELMVTSVVKTSTDRVLGWVSFDPNDETKRRPIAAEIDEDLIRRSLNMEGKQHDGAWKDVKLEVMKNYSELSRLQLLYSFRYMDKAVIDAVIDEAKRRGVAPKDVEKLRTLAVHSKEFFFYGKQLKQFLPLHMKILKGATIRSAEYYRGKAKDHLLHQLGYIDTDTGPRKKNPMIVRFGLDGFDRHMHDYFRKNSKNWRGIGSRYFRQAAFDVGNIDGVAQVARAWCESGGDPDETAKVALREMLYALPVIGQVASFATTLYTGGLVAGANQGFMMVACMAVPVAGMAALAFSLGEAGLVIHEHSYAKPLANAVEDAIYRGYVGPSLYDFSQDTPGQFQASHRARLATLQEQIKAIGRNNPTKKLVPLLIEERGLLIHKGAWGAYLGEQKRSEGGAFFGYGKFDSQVKLKLEGDPEHPSPTYGMAGPLLARVTPVIFFPRGRDGVVDFTVRFTDTDRVEFDQLPEEIEEIQKTDPLTAYRLADRLGELTRKKVMQERAGRYLAAAQRNHELMHQIRLDSLAPYIASDTTQEMVSPERFVNFWAAIRRETLGSELEALGIPVSVSTMQRARLALRDRLVEDIERSRTKWQKYQFTKVVKKKAREELLEKRMGSVVADAIMDTVADGPKLISERVLSKLRKFGNDVKTQLTMDAINEAIGMRSIPSSDPYVAFAVRIIKGDKDAAEEEDKQDELRVDMKVVADPRYYGGTYSTSAHQLGPQSARAAASSKSYKGLPLGDAQVKMLKDYVKEIGELQPDQEQTTPAILLFGWCTEHNIPDRVVPETIARLPRLKEYTIPNGDGARGFLLGGGVSWVPKPQKTGPIQIVAHRKTPGLEKYTTVDVTSVAVGKLEDLPEGARLQLQLEFAFEEEGEFQPLEMHKLLLQPRSKIYEKAEHAGSLRMPEDKVLFILSGAVSGELWKEKKQQLRPAYFRVVERIIAADKEEGEETFSNTTEIGPVQVRVSGGEEFTNETEVKTSAQLPTRAIVRLECVNQRWWFPGATLTVTKGPWTGHFVVGRADLDRKYGKRWGEAQIDFPGSWNASTLEIDARSEEFQASHTVRVVTTNTVKPETLKERQESTVKYHEERLKGLAARVASSEKKLKELLTAMPALAADPKKRRQLFNNKISQHSNRHTIRLLKEYEIPYEEGQRDCRTNDHYGDQKKRLAGAWQTFEVLPKRFEITRWREKEYAALQDGHYPGSTSVQDQRRYAKILERRAENAATRPLELEDAYNGVAIARIEDVRSASIQAGDLESLRRSTEILIKLRAESVDIKKRQGKESPERIAEFEKSAKKLEKIRRVEIAERTHLFTGNREKAAALWVKAHELYPEVPLLFKPWDEMPILPAWWPESPDGSLYRP